MTARDHHARSIGPSMLLRVTRGVELKSAAAGFNSGLPKPVQRIFNYHSQHDGEQDRSQHRYLAKPSEMTAEATTTRPCTR